MREFQSFRVFSFALLVAVCGGCGQETSPPIRIGANVWPGYECLFLAKTKRFYEAQGVDVELIEYGSLSDVRRAFERGQIDVAASTMIEVIQSREFSERRMQVFLVTDYSDGADVILAAPGIDDVRALKGKVVGAEPASLGVFLLSRALEENGMSLDDVTMTPMNQQELESAFLNGKVDAVVTYPPVSSHITAKTNANIVFSSRDIPLQVVDVLSADADLLASQPEVFHRIVRAWDQAVQFMRDNPDEAHAINAARQGLNPTEFADSLQGIQITRSNEQREAWGADGTLLKLLATAKSVLQRSGELGDVALDGCLYERRFEPELAFQP